MIHFPSHLLPFVLDDRLNTLKYPYVLGIMSDVSYVPLGYKEVF